MARDRVTLEECRRRAAMITKIYNVTIRLDADARRPRLMINRGTIAAPNWRVAIPVRSTGEFMTALNAFEEGIDAGRATAPPTAGYATVEVHGGIATVSEVSDHVIIKILDLDIDADGNPAG